jgi:hypothetical protein
MTDERVAVIVNNLDPLCEAFKFLAVGTDCPRQSKFCQELSLHVPLATQFNTLLNIFAISVVWLSII